MKNTLFQAIGFFMALNVFGQSATMRIIRENVFNPSGTTNDTTFYSIYSYSNDSTLNASEILSFKPDTNGQFYNYSKEIKTYDSLGRETERIYIEWDGNQWRNKEKLVVAYDIYNNSIERTTYYWFAGNWYERVKFLYTYSSTNLLLTDVRMDTLNNTLTNSIKNQYTYDNQNRLTEKERFSWSNNVWEAVSKDITFYATSGNKTDSTLIYGWNTASNTYDLVRKTLYDYNVANQLSDEFGYKFLNNNWENDSKRNYLYNANNIRIKSVFSDWFLNSWRLREIVDSDFDAQNRLLTTITQQLNNVTDSVENRLKREYGYAADSSLITSEFFQWNNGAWTRTFFLHSIFESIQQLPSVVAERTTIKAKAYPNPFAVNTIIEFESKEAGQATIHITDNTGRIVFEEKQNIQPGINAVLWNAIDDSGNSLSEGLYFFVLKAENLLITNKLMKL